MFWGFLSVCVLLLFSSCIHVMQDTDQECNVDGIITLLSKSSIISLLYGFLFMQILLIGILYCALRSYGVFFRILKRSQVLGCTIMHIFVG